MLDINLVRNNPELVKENIRKKFQDQKLELVDKVLELDINYRSVKTSLDELRAKRNSISASIGECMRNGQKEEAEAKKEEVTLLLNEIKTLEKQEETLGADVKRIMMVLPNIIDESVPVGKDDSENVEIERFLEPKVPNFEVPYHVDILEGVDGIDLDSARKTSGIDFSYLTEILERLSQRF